MTKTEVAVLATDAVAMSAYQSIIRSNASKKKFTMTNDITIYDDISAVRTQLAIVANFYFDL